MEVQAAINETEDVNLNRNAMRSCGEAARKVEELIFSVGGARRLVTTFSYFRERTLVRELQWASVVESAQQ